MGVDYVTLTARWQGRFCGRRGTKGQPVAGGCDFHCCTEEEPDCVQQFCFRFGLDGNTIGAGDLTPDPIPLHISDDGATLRCKECIEKYGEE